MPAWPRCDLTAAASAAVLLALLILPARAQGQDAGPRDSVLVCEPATLDLGALPAGGRHPLEVVLRNRGKTPIRLRYIHTQCDCTLTSPHEGVVPGGGSLVLVLELNLEDREPGPLEEQVTILTDVARQPELNIPVRVTVVARRDQDAP